MARVLCAMSGGVDSSVAAALLKEAGHEVLGIFLRLGPGGDSVGGSSRACCSVNDAQDASRVADRLGIPFYALNYQGKFSSIIEYFVDEYNKGRTPNPCARCNQWLKFGTLLDEATKLECEYLATGHYAQISHPDDDSPSILRRGADPAKDQSYFLFAMPPTSLKRVLFPVGDYSKDRIREMAEERDLPVAHKADSQEICFVPEDNYRKVLQARTPELIKPGRFVDTSGEDLGEHQGHQNYTIGQRRGLGIAFGEPKYVVGIDAPTNTITLGSRDELHSSQFEVAEINWLSMVPQEPGLILEGEMQIRHQGTPHPARVEIIDSQRAKVELFNSASAITPGQAAVLYDGDKLLMGGWIE